jgi:butyryl-CoA dehydrogenase
MTIPSWTEHSGAEDDRLGAMTDRLAAADGPADEAETWPAALWSILTDSGAMRWSLPVEIGGDPCTRPALIERYARAAEGSLTAAFILTQRDSAVRRLRAASDRIEARRWLGEIAAGRAFTTVGISQLSTSRRAGAQALKAVAPTAGVYHLKGMMPWVTATDRAGLTVRPSFPLAALQASCTAEVACDDVPVSEADVLAGPALDILTTPGQAGPGGLETSALALGQARAALAALQVEAPARDELAEPAEALAEAWQGLWADLIASARGEPDAVPPAQIRGRANALVLRITQAYLTARKGSGFLLTDSAQRWARQALFFLVWSCPGPVAQAAIRDLAGLCSA